MLIFNTLFSCEKLADVAEGLLPELKLIGDIFCLKKDDIVKWFETKKQWINVETIQKVLGFRAPALEDLRRSGYCKPLN
jgi:hypothetical protein